MTKGLHTRSRSASFGVRVAVISAHLDRLTYTGSLSNPLNLPMQRRSARVIFLQNAFYNPTSRRTPMTAFAAVAAILAALLMGAMSPGPSFVLVARNAIGLSRTDGLATALGMGVGGVFFSGIALA